MFYKGFLGGTPKAQSHCMHILERSANICIQWLTCLTNLRWEERADRNMAKYVTTQAKYKQIS